MTWLTEFIGRGSCCDIPVKELPDYYRRLGCPLGRTDIIVITDAQVIIEEEWRSRFNAWKREVKCEGHQPGHRGRGRRSANHQRRGSSSELAIGRRGRGPSRVLSI
jgi:hypothetical protein